MNKIKKEFENVKLSKNKKIELYNSIISKLSSTLHFFKSLYNPRAFW